MVGHLKKVGENRYRETFSWYYDDFKVGDIYEHRPGKTVTEYDNHTLNFSAMLSADARDTISPIK